jgi:hypothetical protein
MKNLSKLSSLYFLVAFFSTAHAQEAPPSSDIRCLIIGIQMSIMTDTPRRTVGNMVVLYYFGRLNPFPPKVIEDAIAKEGIALAQTDLKSEADRCGKELSEKSQLMTEIGKNLVRRGSELEEKPHATATPPEATPEPPSEPLSLGATPSGRTHPSMDPDHPLRIGEEFYPPESRRLQEPPAQ